jgi:hypothetical protein
MGIGRGEAPLHRQIEHVMADVWLGLALTCSYTLVAMAVVFVFL